MLFNLFTTARAFLLGADTHYIGSPSNHYNTRDALYNMKGDPEYPYSHWSNVPNGNLGIGVGHLREDEIREEDFIQRKNNVQGISNHWLSD